MEGLPLGIIILMYIVLAGIVVGASIKLAQYVDLIDKKTNLSGAFIGGVLLAAVTSLPEMFTSISAVTYVKTPELVLGNILGSNIFNLCVLALMIIIFAKRFTTSRLSKSHSITTIFTIVCYLVVGVAVLLGIDPQIVTLSIFSLLILLLYVVGVRYMATDTDEEKDEDESKLTLKQVVTRFILLSVLLVIASIFVTKVTDVLSVKLNLGATLAGALFLGVATSLPEFTTTITLTKMGKFNTATGNILGSNLFNFFMLFLSDLLFIGNATTASIYVDPTKDAMQTKYLVLFGIISSISFSLILAIKARKNKSAGATGSVSTSIVADKRIIFYVVLSAVVLLSYVAFLVLA